MTKTRKDAPTAATAPARTAPHAAAPAGTFTPRTAARCAAILGTLDRDMAQLSRAVLQCRAVVRLLPDVCAVVDVTRGAQQWAADMDRVHDLAGAAGVLMREVENVGDQLDQRVHDAAQRMGEALDEAAGVMRAMLREAEAGGAHLAAAGLARQWLRTHTGQDEPSRFDPAEDEAAFVVGMPASSRAPAAASAGKGA